MFNLNSLISVRRSKGNQTWICWSSKVVLKKIIEIEVFVNIGVSINIFKYTSRNLSTRYYMITETPMQIVTDY